MMNLTSFPLDLSINDAPTLILDPDPSEAETELKSTVETQVKESINQELIRPRLELDLEKRPK